MCIYKVFLQINNLIIFNEKWLNTFFKKELINSENEKVIMLFDELVWVKFIDKLIRDSLIVRA